MASSVFGLPPWGESLWGAPGGEALTGEPLPVIITAKELAEGFQPLLLAEFTFLDGSVLRASSENLDSAEGGPQWHGVDWLPRLKAQQLAGISAYSNNGIVQSPNLTLTLTDADKFVLNTYEWTNGRGFKGATLKLYFIFADLSTGSFTPDYRVIFVGTCNPPAFDAGTITIKSDNLLNMTRKNLPQVRVQNTCNWLFPSTHAQRLDGMNNDQSPYFHCGYSPDMSDPRARGNMNPATGQPYTSCGLTYGDCVARLGNAALPTSAPPGQFVQIEVDQQNRQTGRFSGIFWNPPYDWRGVEYISGSKTEGINSNNDAKLNDYYPLVYGTDFVNPIVMNVVGDPNSTRFEVALCVGKLTDDPTNPFPVQAVLVNDLLIPFQTQTSDLINRWYWDTTGDRTGATMKTAIYNGAGNCYGGIATLLIIVPVSVQASSSVPAVRVLTSGPPIRVTSAGTTPVFTEEISANPVWILLDMLLRTDWKMSQINLDSFVRAASYCNQAVDYIALDGTSKTHQRYRAGLVYRDPRTVHECVTNFMASWRGMLRSSTINGNLEVLIRSTLADQQPNPIPASNNQTAIGSFKADGTTANGYLAYDFNESNIKWVNGATTLRFEQRPYADTPNKIAATFQDEEAGYVNDTLTLFDTDDVARIGQTIKSNLTAEGLLNYDQAYRILESMEAEQFRGNPRTPIAGMAFDTGGTVQATFMSTARVIDLRCGDIVKLAVNAYSISALFRVQKVTPAADYEEAEIVATWHKDVWYADAYGQTSPATSGKVPGDTGGGGVGGGSTRAPFAWDPNQIAPSAADALKDPTDLSFNLNLGYATASNGGTSGVLTVSGLAPVNVLSTVAKTPFTPTVTTRPGGTVPIGTYWIAVSAVDASGIESSASTSLPSVTVMSPGELDITGIVWGSGTAGWKAFAGTNPNHLSLQSSGTGTPASITISAFNVATEGPPDGQFRSLEVDVTREWHAGVWQAPIASFTANTVHIAGGGWVDNQWAGDTLSLLGRAAAGAVPLAHWAILANTADTLTVGPNAAGNTPDLTALGIQVGDVVAMRARGIVVTSTSIGDPAFINSLPELGPTIAIANLAEVTPLIVRTVTPHGYATNDRVLVSDVGTDGTGQWIITVIDSFQFSLNGSGASALDYMSGGEVQRMTFGLVPNAEVGNTVEIIAGTGVGQVRNIVANDETSVTIGAQWDLNPDASSLWIIREATPLFVVSSAGIQNSNPATPLSVSIDIGTRRLQTFAIKAFTVAPNGAKSLVNDSPFREIYVGEPPSFRTKSGDSRYIDGPAYIRAGG